MKKPFISLALLLVFSTHALPNDIDVTQLYHSAQSGDTQAQLDLACTGEGVEKSYQEAVKWYRKAAEQGNAMAQAGLAACYYDGIGVEKNGQEAVKWYRKAAEQGNAVAQVSLANCYYGGIGVEKSYQEAVKWYRKAAEQGDVKAQKTLISLTNKCEKAIALNKEVEKALYEYENLGFKDRNMSDLGDHKVDECIKALEEYRDHFVECDNPACKNKASEVRQETRERISNLNSDKTKRKLFKCVIKTTMTILLKKMIEYACEQL